MNIFDNIDIINKQNIFESIHIIKNKFKTNDIIFRQNSLCNYLTYIKKGNIKALRKYDDGINKPIRYLKSSDYIAINLIFSSDPYYKADFIALDEVETESISKEDLLKLLKNETILKNYLQILSDLAIKQNEYLKLINIKTIRGKVCYFLYEEYLKYNSLEFKTNYTKEALSKLLNIKRPSLGNEIKKLCDDKIIENTNRDYKILSLELLLKSIEEN